MLQRRATRINRELTPAEQERLAEYRRQIAAELPDLQARDQLRKDARQESTFSGELRRAVHQSRHPLDAIARDAGMPVELPCDWLAGDRTLRSDVLDRVAQAVGAEMSITLRPRCRRPPRTKERRLCFSITR